MSRSQGRDALALLEAAQEELAAGRPAGAASCLRSALELHPPYLLHARAGKVLADVLAAGPASAREARIAVVGPTTTALLVQVLAALAFRDRIAARFYEGVYGAYRQEILDPTSGLYRFGPTVTLILTHWRDLALPPVVDDEEAAVEQVVTGHQRLWAALAASSASHVVQHAYDFPIEESHGYAAGNAGGRARVIARVNEELVRRAPAHVSVVDQAAVQREVGAAWQDDRLWHVAQQHPSPEALPRLADLQMAHTRAVLGLARKVLVTDLDNALWGGDIGEDGREGIRIGPGSAVGEAYARLQDYLLELKRSGVLLCACSKNDPADAERPFRDLPQMRLRLDDFVAFVANWEDKAHNIREIGRLLSLGTDSFVFLDDNPLERDWVRAQVPDVAVVELGPTPFSYVRDLDRPRHFFTLGVTEEDRLRSQFYREEAGRQVLRTRFESIDEFLRELQMRGAMEPISGGNLARVAQLINKTNQFNLTGRRHSAAEIEALLARRGAWGAAFSLSDRFGTHGLVAVVLCALQGSAWEIETWVMSCRVLGRGLERFILEQVLAAARDAGVERLVGVYRPTPRNSLVANLFGDLGFRPLDKGGVESRYERSVAAGSWLPSHAILPEPQRAPEEPTGLRV